MQQTYPCRQCGMSFRSQLELEEHYRLVHGQQSSYEPKGGAATRPLCFIADGRP